MTLIICWLVFPLVLGIVALGCGLLVEALAGVQLPAALVAPAGLALVVVAAGLATASGDTAQFATPLVLALAAAGLMLSPPWRRWPLWRERHRAGLWAAAAAAGIFACYAAPVVLSGEATIAGYIKLDDSATFLALIDRAMEHGRSLAGLGPSSYETTLAFYLAYGYPLGSLVPLGVGGRLVGQDIAWLYQPYLALMASMLGLGLYEIVRPAIASRPARALAAFAASQAALLYAYALWGGVKEVAAAWLVALVAALVPAIGQSAGPGSPPGFAGPRSLLPLAVAVAATLDALSAGGAVWLAPALILAAAVLLFARGWRAFVGRAVAFAALTLVLAAPAVLTASTFLRPQGQAGLTSAAELGNLLRPLDERQLLGIWPAGDFRLDPAHLTVTNVLLGVVVLAGLLGLAVAVRRRSWALVTYGASSALGAVALDATASPWVAGKGFATASPAFVLLAFAGAGWIRQRAGRAEATLVALAITGGVLWSNALGYRDVNLAPRDRLAELEHIGERFAGAGPALMTEYEPFGVRHFLRRLDAEGASELRRRQVPLTDGSLLPKSGSADLDRFQLPGLLVYRTLVIRRSPAESRPPSAYRLAWQGRYYDVWQRPEPFGPPILEHLALGDPAQSGAIPRCADVLRLAHRPGAVTLAAPRSAPNSVVDLLASSHPRSWTGPAQGPGGVLPLAPGTDRAQVYLPAAGRYGIYLRGAFRPRLSIAWDGRTVLEARHLLTHSNDDEPLGQLHAGAGAHRIELRFGGPDLHPGSGGLPFAIGPILLGLGGDDRPLLKVPASQARALCGQRLDWVEALAG